MNVNVQVSESLECLETRQRMYPRFADLILQLMSTCHPPTAKPKNRTKPQAKASTLTAFPSTFDPQMQKADPKRKRNDALEPVTSLRVARVPVVLRSRVYRRHILCPSLTV